MRLALLVALLPLLGMSAGCLNEFSDPHYVRIVNVDLQPEEVLSQDAILNVTSTLDNRGGGDSGQIRLFAKAYSEDSGFLVAENETQVGIISGDTTRPVSMMVKVPRSGNIRIDVSVFEDGQGKERSSISARNLGALAPGLIDTGLRIRDMDFLVQSVFTEEGRNSSRARIQADLYVTNEGRAPSEDLRIQVKAREISTRLVSDVAWIETGSIPTGSTLIRSTNVTVADGYNYAIEVLTWRGDVVVARNEGTVQLAPTFTKPKDQELVTTNPNVNDFLPPPTYATPAYEGSYPTASPRVPGFEVVSLIAAVLATGFVLARRRRSA